jgi:CheY-like chemotaxis protein
MGGDIAVESEYGQGSKFTATITQEIRGGETIGEEGAAEIISGKHDDDNIGGANKKDRRTFTCPNARILVVDDSITNIYVIKGLLKPYGAIIDTAEGGKEAVDLVSSHKYDLVFMDHLMPGMDGLEAVAAIRSTNGDYFKNLPVIALTANAIAGMKEMFLSKGFSDYLSKPIEIERLTAIMAEWIPEKEKKI